MFIMFKIFKYIFIFWSVFILGSCYNKSINQGNRVSTMKTKITNNTPSWHTVGDPYFTTQEHDHTKLITSENGNIYLAFNTNNYFSDSNIFLNQYDKTYKVWKQVYVNSVTWKAPIIPSTSDITASSDNIYLAFIDYDSETSLLNLRILQYNETRGKYILSKPFNVSSQIKNINIAVNPKTNLPCVSFSDYQDNKNQIQLMCYNFSNDKWEKLTTAYSNVEHTEYNKLAFTKDGTPYLAFAAYGFNLGRAIVISYNFTTNSWQNVGAVALSTGIAEYINLLIDANDKIFLTFNDQGNQNHTQVLTYDTRFNNWKIVGGSSLNYRTGKYTNLFLSHNNELYIAFQDYDLINNVSIFHLNNNTQQWDLVVNSNLTLNSIYELSLTIDDNDNFYMALSNANKGLTKLYNQSLNKWEDATLPNILNNIQDPQLAITTNGNLYMSFENYNIGGYQTFMKYDPNSQKINTLNRSHIFGDISQMLMSPKDELFYAYRSQEIIDAYGATVMKYNESIESFDYLLKGYQRGHDLDNVAISFAIDNTLYLAYTLPDNVSNYNTSVQKLFVLKYDEFSKVWIDVMNSSDYGRFSKFFIGKDGLMYFVFLDTNIVMSYNQNTRQWNKVLQLKENPKIVLLDHARDKLYFNYFDSHGIEVYDLQAKQQTTIYNAHTINAITIDKQGTLYMLYEEYTNKGYAIAIDTYKNGILHTLPNYLSIVGFYASMAVSNDNILYVFYVDAQSNAGMLIYYQ